MSTRYYFDHAASAPRRDEVADAMAPWQHGVVGNPSGSHRAARDARRAVEEARDEVAAFVGAKPSGVVFTAGGTESCHLAVVGVASHYRRLHERCEIIVSAIEHHAVADAANCAAQMFDNVIVHRLGVDHDGVVDLEELIGLVNERTALVSVMAVNNETGVIEPLDTLNAAAKTRGDDVVTHSDAVAAAPWLELSDVTASSDLVSLCAHKLGGPVNSGALIARGSIGLDAVTPGGGQERGLRGGTVDVAAVVGLAAALRATARERVAVYERVRAYQEKLLAAFATLPGVRATAAGAARVPGTVHVTFDGLASDEILFLLDEAGVCASAAASCSSGAASASHVLEAMGVEHSRARGSVRFSMGPETSDEDVDALTAITSNVIHRLYDERSSLSPGRLEA